MVPRCTRPGPILVPKLTQAHPCSELTPSVKRCVLSPAFFRDGQHGKTRRNLMDQRFNAFGWAEEQQRWRIARPRGVTTPVVRKVALEFIFERSLMLGPPFDFQIMTAWSIGRFR